MEWDYLFFSFDDGEPEAKVLAAVVQATGYPFAVQVRCKGLGDTDAILAAVR